MGRRDYVVRFNNNNNNNNNNNDFRPAEVNTKSPRELVITQTNHMNVSISTATAYCIVNLVQKAAKCSTQHGSATCCSSTITYFDAEEWYCGLLTDCEKSGTADCLQTVRRVVLRTAYRL
jgi:hypothetical protein